MKKILLIATAVFAATSLFSQDPTLGENIETFNDDFLRPGRLYGGGTINFSGTSEKHSDADGDTQGPKQNNITILPEVGYVFSEKYAAAIALGYSSSTNTNYQFNSNSDDDWELKNKSGMFLVSPMFKAYKKISNRLYCMPTLDVTLGFGNSSDEFVGFNNDTGVEEIQSDEYKEFAFGVGLRAGLKYFPAKEWAVSLSYGELYYNTSTSTDKEDTDHKWTNNSYGLNLNLSSVRVGAYYFFN